MPANAIRWPVVILGCGYTGERVARLFLQEGRPVFATTRSPERLAPLARAGAAVVGFDTRDGPGALDWVPEGARLLYSIPPAEPPTDDNTPDLVQALSARVTRAVYLSTTGVYGSTADVDENTIADATDGPGKRRLQAEAAVLQALWSAAVLRPAAIYGPGRGVHVRMARRTFQLVGKGENYVSRIHVDDLAATAAAALASSVRGAWPVADRLPCTAREIAAYCAELLGLPLPPSVEPVQVHHTRRANRRVDGSFILEELGIHLRYPTYREGIPASIAAQDAPLAVDDRSGFSEAPDKQKVLRGK